MTEIHIERKAAVWPWIVGLLLLALAVWVVLGMMGDEQDTTEQMATEAPAEAPAAGAGRSGAVPQAVQDYAAFARSSTMSPGRDHEYTAEGIRRLTAALQAHVEQNANDTQTKERFERFRAVAERIQKDPQSTAHSNMVRDAFTSAVDVFESAKVDAGEVTNLRQTASSIAPDQPLLDQSERLTQFFRQSAETLERAARRS